MEQAYSAGRGALCEIDAHHGEIKSMRTASAYLRRGVAPFAYYIHDPNSVFMTRWL